MSCTISLEEREVSRHCRPAVASNARSETARRFPGKDLARGWKAVSKQRKSGSTTGHWDHLGPCP